MHEKVDGSSLLGSVGGILGLYMGMSLLTLIEVTLPFLSSSAHESKGRWAFCAVPFSPPPPVPEEGVSPPSFYIMVGSWRSRWSMGLGQRTWTSTSKLG